MTLCSEIIQVDKAPSALLHIYDACVVFNNDLKTFLIRSASEVRIEEGGSAPASCLVPRSRLKFDH